MAAALPLVRRHWIPSYLESPVSLALVVAAFCAADALQDEAGLIATTLMGFGCGHLLGERARPIQVFKENLQVLAIGALFLVLSARLPAADLLAVASPALLLFLAALILVVRPLGVTLATAGSGLSQRERAYLACLAPRGIVAAAVASVFSLRLSEAGVPGAQALAPLTFLTILGTVSIYGLAAAPLARALGVAQPPPRGVLILGAHAWGQRLAEALQAAGLRACLIDANYSRVAQARLAGLEAVYANVLSEYAQEQLDPGGLSVFLATTANDEVNTLAVERYQEVFGRANVFQVQPQERRSPRQALAPRAGARYLLEASAGFAELEERVREGWTVKRSPLSVSFAWADWRALYGAAALPLLLIRQDQVLAFAREGSPDPRPGDLLIALVPPGVSEDEPALPEAGAARSARSVSRKQTARLRHRAARPGLPA